MPGMCVGDGLQILSDYQTDYRKRGSRVVSALASVQGQSSPVQAKDPYTGSILMHVGSSCKHTGVYNVHLPRIIRN